MPSRIRVLDEHTINKIAAGEVIENPASVIKELVENSIDAGATEITVEIAGGGRQLIRVSDNGCGMNQDDALLCLERHATSKIRDVEDILAIGTMGFRGEAIPSIASISKFTLLTCPSDTPVGSPGTMLLVEGGKVLKCCPVVCSRGTTIEVKSLFFNVPVRRKFQKSPVYDSNEIHKMLTLLALGHPAIRFALINNDKKTLSSNGPAAKEFLDILSARIKDTLGEEYFGSLCPIEIQQDDFSLKGFIGQPAFTKLNRTGQYLFINKRGVYSPAINYIVREGYGTTLSSNRHPIYVLHLSLPGEYVDVNVHPQKKEVRLRNEERIRQIIIQGIEKALRSSGVTLFQPEVESEPFRPQFAAVQAPPPAASLFEKPNFFALQLDEPDPMPAKPAYKAQEIQEAVLPFATLEYNSPTPIPRIISTIKGYILLDCSILPKAGELSLLDQKAAHSRIIFERLIKHAERKSFAIQSLLVPHILEMTKIEANLLKESLDSLNKLGIQIREFGETTFAVEAIPEVFGKADIQEVIMDLLQEIQNGQEKSSLERNLAKSASKSAVPSTRKLPPEEAQALVSQLMNCENPWKCPWGKPTLITLQTHDIEGLFHKKQE